jgi:hypothetical protein
MNIFVIDNNWIHLANILSSQLTLFVTLFFFSNTKTLNVWLLPHSRGMNQDKL